MPKDPNIHTVLKCEMRLAQRGDPALKDLLDSEFCEFGQSGQVWSRDDVADELGNPARNDVKLTNLAARYLSDAVILCTYESNSDRGRVRRSSLWRQCEGRWLLVFHQGTPVPEGSKA